MKSLGLMQGVEEGKGEEMKRKTILAVQLALSGLLISGLPRLAGAAVFEDATWSQNAGNNDRLYTYSDDENEFRITDSYQATAILVNNGAQVEINATTGSNTATDNYTGRTNAWWGAWVNDSSTLTMNAAQNNEITGMGIRDTAVYANNGGQIHLEADKNILKGVNSAVSVVTPEANIEVIGRSGNEISISSQSDSSTKDAVFVNQGTTTIKALNGDNVISSTDPDNEDKAVYAKFGAEASIIAEKGSNVFSSTHIALNASGRDKDHPGELREGHLLVSAEKDNVMTVSTSAAGEGV
ncbi:MAG: hypothetical protein LKE33_11810 [Acidaminococcus sp.]|jgi:uncharacterized protein|nr:hypothetical protein [Acidaminococcus sp.]MCI2099649.1 hypothetical protein [Acidaminococcus sp.]MCI2113734.1 hypothetical protein [Acidaminococcus sp.]MCI2115817.1 hypothetical protein [Acidaminococcus sp.]